MLVGPPESAMPTPEIGSPEMVPGKETVPEMVQFVEQLTAVTDNVKDCVAFGDMPLFAVSVIELTDAPVGVPLRTPVAVLKVTPVGNVPVSLNVDAGNPDAVTVKFPSEPTVKVAVD